MRIKILVFHKINACLVISKRCNFMATFYAKSSCCENMQILKFFSKKAHCFLPPTDSYCHDRPAYNKRLMNLMLDYSSSNK